LPHEPLTVQESAERLRGIGLICAAVANFTLIDTAAKFAAAHGIPTLEVVWARYAVSLVVAVLLLRPWRRPVDYVTRRPLSQGVRAVFLLLSTVFNFIAIQHLQLSESVAINFASPLIVTALAGPVLGEWAGPRRWAAVVVGFIGVVIVAEPDPGAFQPAVLFSLASAFAYAGYALTTRLLSATESPGGMLVYGSLVGTIALTAALPTATFVTPDWAIACVLIISGTAAAIGHWFVILANRHTPATVLAPFSYTQILSMIAAGYLVFGDVPSLSTLLGALVIVASGLYILYRQRVHRDR
jgi:drug/metabolite transporter (DMT)-like permease